ncbi:MATE family efflux transporter [Lachnospiraceae bacterium 47-T17]
MATLFYSLLIFGLGTQGRARTASIGMSVGGILNVALDPLFIFGLHMNVAGAALATCISNVVSVLYLLGHIIRTRKESTVQLAVFPQRIRLSYVAEVFSVGAPAALQIVLASVSNSVMIRLMSGYVESAISGLGIAQKIEMIPFQIVQGLSSGVLPLIAYNYASGNRKRMDSAVRFSLAAGAAISVVLFVMVELSAPWLVRFFYRRCGYDRIWGSLYPPAVYFTAVYQHRVYADLGISGDRRGETGFRVVLFPERDL